MKKIIKAISDWWYLRRIPNSVLRELVENAIERERREFQEYCERNT
jgi:hypothetical protein